MNATRLAAIEGPMRDLEASTAHSDPLAAHLYGEVVALVAAYRKATAPVTIDCEARRGVATITTDPRDAIARLTERVVCLRALLGEVQDRMAETAKANVALRADAEDMKRRLREWESPSQRRRWDEARELAKAMVVASQSEPQGDWPHQSAGKGAYESALAVLRGIDDAQAAEKEPKP